MPNDLQCPNCGKSYPASTRICVNCGIYLRTGQPILSHAPVIPPASHSHSDSDSIDLEPRLGPIRYTFAFILAALPGLRRPTILIASIIMTALAFMLIAGAFFMFVAFMTIFTACAMGAIGLIAFAQAISWMVLGEFQILHDALAEFTSAQWNVFIACLFAPVAILGSIAYFNTRNLPPANP